MFPCTMMLVNKIDFLLLWFENMRECVNRTKEDEKGMQMRL